MTLDRPKDEKELQEREAIGVIRASRFVRRYAQSHDVINIDAICKIHKEIFKDAWPEIAGTLRKEELSITDSDLQLPHPSNVSTLMKELDIDLADKIKKLDGCQGRIVNIKNGVEDNETMGCVEKVLHTTSWLHHKITAIHPFREGNGRTARLAGNLILERYGIVGISVKLERDNKNIYLNALKQIDKYEDYEPLEEIISEGIVDRYNGVAMKYYKA